MLIVRSHKTAEQQICVPDAHNTYAYIWIPFPHCHWRQGEWMWIHPLLATVTTAQRQCSSPPQTHHRWKIIYKLSFRDWISLTISYEGQCIAWLILRVILYSRGEWIIKITSAQLQTMSYVSLSFLLVSQYFSISTHTIISYPHEESHYPKPCWSRSFAHYLPTRGWWIKVNTVPLNYSMVQCILTYIHMYMHMYGRMHCTRCKHGEGKLEEWMSWDVIDEIYDL